MPVDVPCGQCIGCRLERSRQWALRCCHEAQLHKDNSFVTLTYSDEHLPDRASLDHSDFQKFMKRLRKSIQPKKIKFYMCGEYGENKAYSTDPSISEETRIKHLAQYGSSELGRPHYHVIIFGHSFSDLLEHSVRNGHVLYTSPKLEKLWPQGFNTVGEVNFETAAYVARYVTKKINGEQAITHYTRVFEHEQTGEAHQIKPEYTTMSRAEGIGKNWFKEFKSDVYPKDFTTINGKKIKPPKYYDRILEETDIDLFERVKARRQAHATKHNPDNEPDRLLQRENVKKAQAKMLKRNL
jgi:hypothetical protein